MCRKSFTVATFVRHSISKLPANTYSFHMDIIEHQIATGKGFSAHTPVINCIFQSNNTYRDSSPLSPVLILMASLRS
jgi:hypothetical protein